MDLFKRNFECIGYGASYRRLQSYLKRRLFQAVSGYGGIVSGPRLHRLARGGSLGDETKIGGAMLGNERPSIDEGYFIVQNAHLMDKATTYDEAIKKGKALKRTAPESNVEIIFDGVAAEILAGRA